jgi:tRNA A37 threonylcarbamoyladenosine modification protein TsaB
VQSLLAIETSSSVPTLAWRTDAGVVCEKEIPSGRGCAVRLVLELDELRRGGFVPDIVAVGCGPGSYSGIRGGITAASGFSRTTGAKLVGFASLFCVDVTEDRFVGFGDAGRGLLYRAVVTRSVLHLNWELIAPAVANPDEAGVACYAISSSIPCLPSLRVVVPRARRLIKLVDTWGLDRGERSPRPIYLQGPVAEITK